MTTATRILTGPRWSSAPLCARQTVYQGLGVVGEPYPEDTQRRFARGTRIGKAMADEVIARMASQGRRAVAEVEVPWPPDDPVGVGHADLDMPDEDTVIEIVSTKDASLPANKALQVAGYATFLGRSTAKVLSVDPSTGYDRVYPVNLEALVPIVAELVARIRVGLDGGELPPRLNGHADASPGAYPCLECPWRAGCWADYTPPPYGRLPGAEDDLIRLLDIDAEAKRVRKLAKDLEDERDEIRETLAERMEPGVDYIEGGVRVRRTRVEGRRSLSFADMEAAGYSLPPEVAEFVKQGASWDKWTVKEMSA